MSKCLVIGAVMLDIVMNVEKLPKTGEDIYASSQGMHIGGCAYNVASILKLFKIPYKLFTPIGDGIYGKIISDKLKAVNQESLIYVSRKDNGYCLCIVEKNGERTFITLPGVECEFQKQWFEKLLGNYSDVYISGYEIEGNGGEAIIEFLEQNRKMQIYYAPGPRITFIEERKHKRIMNLHPIVHLNEKEAIDYTKEKNYKDAARAIQNESNNSVIVTLGDKGCYLLEEGGKKILTEKVKVIDTTGAGDSHIGTIIAMKEKGYNLEKAIKIANKVSAKVVSVNGSTLTNEEFLKGDFLNE